MSGMIDKYEPEVSVPVEAVGQEMRVVDDILARAVRMGDPTLAFSYVRQAKMIGQLKGLGVARVLYQTWMDWPKYQQMGVDDEWENVASSQCSLTVEQCRKYRDLVADVYENPAIPAHIKVALQSKPIESQLAVRAAAKEGDLDEDQWQEVIDAVSPAEVRSIVRDARGERTSAGSRIVIWEDRQHRLHAKQGSGGGSIIIGVLRATRDDLEGDDYEHRVRAIAVDRIRRAVGIVQQ
jgi:hypothetical protein